MAPVRPGFVYDLPWTFNAETYTGGALLDSLLGELEQDEGDDRVADAEDRYRAPEGESVLRLSPTVSNFVRSDADVVQMYSARGEGKTTGAVVRILRVAEDNPGTRLRVCVVRDTWVNLRRALSLDAHVLTPTGWVKAGDVSVGDMLVAVDGTPTRVLGVYPQPDQALWSVCFSDGATARVTGDHLWAVQGRWDREHSGPRNRRCPRDGWWPAPEGLRVTTTDRLRVRLRQATRRQRAWSVPLVEPIQFAARAVPLDPYLLGVLLGDGGFSQRRVQFTTADEEIADRVRGILPHGVTLRHLGRYEYGIVSQRGGMVGQRGARPNPVLDALRHLGLWGRRSPQKFIPDDYLWNSTEIRLQVLRGLLDTDGCVTRERHVSFSSTSEELANGVTFLVRSLGGLTTSRIRAEWPDDEDRTIRHRRPAIELSIQLPPAIIPFLLRRKAQRLEGRVRRPWRWITNVEPAGHGLAVCFRVDHPRRLFVMDDFVVTHNTVFETLRQGTLAGWWEAEFQAGDTECILNGGLAHLFFFGMDRPADAVKFQGFEAGLLWLEEPASAADLSSGIPADVFAMGVSSLRQPGIRHPSTQITMNPPDRSHWTLELQETLDEAGHPDMRCEVFRIPVGENTHLPPGYRERMRLGLEAAQRPDLIRRLSEGNIGTVIVGVPVTPEFSDMHVAKKPIEIRLGWPTYRTYDAGLNPTCIHAQTTPAGHLNIVGCVVGMNMGMEELLQVHVIPWEARMNLRSVVVPLPKKPPRDDYGHVKTWSKARAMVQFRDIGDPACVQREQTHSERSVARIIENLLATTFEKGRVEWSARLNSLRAVLTRNIGGRPMLQVDPDCVPLIEALEGGWHYMRYPSGKVSPLPLKNLACVDEETEILTQIGFRPRSALQVGMPVYGFDLRTRRLKSESLVAVHYSPEPTSLIEWESRALSMALTPNHRMVICRGRFDTGGPIRWGATEFRTANEVTDSTAAIPGIRGASGFGDRRYSDDFIRLSAWVMTEGTYRKDGSNEVWITQGESHQIYVDQISKLAGSWPSAMVRRWDGQRYVFILRHELAELLRRILPNKVPGPQFISQLRRRDLILFLHEALKGDGSHHAGSLALLDDPITTKAFWRAFRKGTPVLCCSNEAEADAVQHMALLAGVRPRRRRDDDHSDCRVSLLRYRKYGQLATTTRRLIQTDSGVWCPQTESGTWIARRRGRIWPTGNSHPGDALSYLTSVLYPSDDLTRRALAPPRGSPKYKPASWAGR